MLILYFNTDIDTVGWYIKHTKYTDFINTGFVYSP